MNFLAFASDLNLKNRKRAKARFFVWTKWAVMVTKLTQIEKIPKQAVLCAYLRICSCFFMEIWYNR